VTDLDVETDLTVERGCGVLGADLFNIKLDLAPLQNSLPFTDQSGCTYGFELDENGQPNGEGADATQSSFTKPILFDYLANNQCMFCDTDGIRIVIDPTTGLVTSVTALITTEGLSHRETVSLSGSGWPDCDSFTTGPQGTGGTAGSGP
jgi:hypothetical protein